MEVTSRNHTVDIFRLIASFFIVFLHVGFDHMDENLVGIIRIAGRWGVPFFFLLSGYFFQPSLNKSPKNALKKNCLRIFNILIVADILYIISIYILDGSYNWKHIFPGAYIHLWFLPSLILGTIVLYLLDKFKVQFHLRLTTALFIICVVLLADSYSSLLHLEKFNLSGKVIPLLSIPYMIIGTFFYNRVWFKNIIKVRLGIPLAILGFIIQLSEVHMIHFYTGRSVVEHQYLIGTLLLSIGIFILAMSLRLKNKTLGFWGKDFSLFIYLYHPLIILLFYKIDYKLFTGNFIILFPIIVFALTLLLAILIHKYIYSLFLFLTGAVKESIDHTLRG